LSKKLPELMKNEQLRIGKHFKESQQTNEHVSRLEKIFEVTGIKPAAEKMRCYGRNFKEVTNSSAKLMWV
jgi:ferritin-like metal-binding protein YciE